MKPDLTDEICELIRITSTDLPAAVERQLQEAAAGENPGSSAHRALRTILANIELARKNSTPICQDTGTPIFFVQYPDGTSIDSLNFQIRQAVALATEKSYLRPNAVDPLSGMNTGNNLGDKNFPSIHFIHTDDPELTIDLILKGGGCENVGAQYSLPDESLDANRDLEGVRKVALHAVFNAQGQGCPPGFLGVGVGGDRGTSYAASKEVFLRGVDGHNLEPALSQLEDTITREANQLGIGPMGFGGKATILGTKIMTTHRLPASYFVTVSYMCWAYRMRRMIVRRDGVIYE